LGVFFFRKYFAFFKIGHKKNVQNQETPTKPPKKTQKVTSEHNALNFVFRRKYLLR